jgi:hypothetical protein
MALISESLMPALMRARGMRDPQSMSIFSGPSSRTNDWLKLSMEKALPHPMILIFTSLPFLSPGASRGLRRASRAAVPAVKYDERGSLVVQENS